MALVVVVNASFAQGKIIIGIMPFKSSAEQGGNYNNRRQNQSQQTTAIEDAVTNVFVQTKRFSLVERQKMDQIKSEKNLQKNEDFIDGSVIEQSKSLGAQYIVMGNVTESAVQKSTTRTPFAGTISSENCDVAFSIKVVDVTTGEIMASSSFSGSGKGKKAFDNAMEDIKPEIEKFIKENFKVTVSVASVEEKNDKGEAVKVLISGGSSLGMKEGIELKVYEASEMMVDGKKLTRKVTIGKVVVAKVEDENFSVCTVAEGGMAIANKVAASAKVKCEITKE
jgi:hypothetical protein